MNLYDVVQFNENHDWCGCLGIITEVKEIQNDIRFMVGVPVPKQGTAYVFVLASEIAIEKIGEAIFMPKREEEE